MTKDSTAVLERPQHDRFNLNAKLYSKDTIYWVQVTLENGNTLKRPARVHAIFKKHGSSDLKDHYFLICWYHHQGDRASWPTWNLPNWEHAEDVNFAEFAHGGFHDVVSGEQMLEDVYGPHLVRGEGKPPKGQCKWDPQMPHDIVEI